MPSGHKKLLASLNQNISLSPREALLCAAVIAFGSMACTMTGIVVGMLISPRKYTTIGSYNGSNNSGACAPSAGTAEKEIEE